MDINYEAVVVAQLNAEIAAKGTNVRRLALDMGESYGSFRRWLAGERPLRMQLVFEILAQLELEPSTFFTRVEERMRDERQTSDPRS